MVSALSINLSCCLLCLLSVYHSHLICHLRIYWFTTAISYVTVTIFLSQFLLEAVLGRKSRFQRAVRHSWVIFSLEVSTNSQVSCGTDMGIFLNACSWHHYTQPPEELKNQPREISWTGRCSGDDVCEKAELTRAKCGKYLQRPGMNVWNSWRIEWFQASCRNCHSVTGLDAAVICQNQRKSGLGFVLPLFWYWGNWIATIDLDVDAAQGWSILNSSGFA